MCKMLRVNVSLPWYVWRIHVEEFGEQLDGALRTNVDGLQERNHKGHKKLPVDVNVDRRGQGRTDVLLHQRLAIRVARAVERSSSD